EGRRRTSLEIDAERSSFDRQAAGTHLVERTQHPPFASQRLVRQADDQPIWRGNRRRRAYLPGDRDFIAVRIERADCSKSARGRTADAGIAMDDQRRAAVPAAHE